MPQPRQSMLCSSCACSQFSENTGAFYLVFCIQFTFVSYCMFNLLGIWHGNLPLFLVDSTAGGIQVSSKHHNELCEH